MQQCDDEHQAEQQVHAAAERVAALEGASGAQRPAGRRDGLGHKTAWAAGSMRWTTCGLDIVAVSVSNACCNFAKGRLKQLTRGRRVGRCVRDFSSFRRRPQLERACPVHVEIGPDRDRPPAHGEHAGRLRPSGLASFLLAPRGPVGGRYAGVLYRTMQDKLAGEHEEDVRRCSRAAAKSRTTSSEPSCRGALEARP